MLCRDVALGMLEVGSKGCNNVKGCSKAVLGIGRGMVSELSGTYLEQEVGAS